MWGQPLLFLLLFQHSKSGTSLALSPCSVAAEWPAVQGARGGDVLGCKP